jgi:hypothetical protein
MTDTMMVVVEFPAELRDAAGHPTGTNRGWLPTSDPVLPLALSRTQEIARSDDLAEVQRLVNDGRCVVTRGQFDALAGLEIVGLDPKRVFPMAWTHLTECATCRTAYETRLVEILQSQ